MPNLTNEEMLGRTGTVVKKDSARKIGWINSAGMICKYQFKHAERNVEIEDAVIFTLYERPTKYATEYWAFGVRRDERTPAPVIKIDFVKRERIRTTERRNDDNSRSNK